MKTARKVNDEIIKAYIKEYEEKNNVSLHKIGHKRWKKIFTDIELTLKQIIKNVDEL